MRCCKKKCRSPRQVSVTKNASKEASLSSETQSWKRSWSRMLCKFLVITCNLVKLWLTSFVAGDKGSSATSSANNPWAHAHCKPYSRDASNSAIPAFISSDTMSSLPPIELNRPQALSQRCGISFFTHSFLPSRTLVPQKKVRVGKRFLYWPVTRYAQPTRSPKINITARDVDWAWWSQGAARWEVSQGGAGPLHHWWRHLLGWRAATMRGLACQHGSKWPTTGKWELWQLLVAGAGGLTVLWFVPTVGGTVLPPRSISHRLPSPGPPNGTVSTPPIPGRCVLLFVVQRAKLSLRTCPLSAVVRLHLWEGRLGLCPPPIGNPAIGGTKIRPTYTPPTDPICCRAEHRPEVAQYKPNKIVNCQTKPPTWPWNDAG